MRESQRERKAVSPSKGCYTLGKNNEIQMYTNLNHVPSFHVFDSAHHVAFLFVNLHVQVVDVRADVFPSRAHLFMYLYVYRERKQEHIGVFSTRVFLPKLDSTFDTFYGTAHTLERRLIALDTDIHTHKR